ncbi:MAG TPA: NAD-dependent epimerase/dehydratase family protein [Longimicrobiales bacterium]|nr:NAD-dependent epimerase/dehydratase family protein [Longimicrobiales bacterium]
MKILVTGAAGFIGSSLVDRLLGAGHAVVGLDVYDDFYDPATKEANLVSARDMDAFQEVRGDIRDLDVLASLPEGIDAVVHLAARAGVRPSIADPGLYSSVNVQGTTEILEWMRRRGVRNLVFASSSSVYGNNEKVPFSEDDAVDRPISPYAATKKAGELLCHAFHHLFGMSVVCLRFFTVYGARQRPDLAIHKFARLLAQGRPVPLFGDGSSERDYTFIEDILDGVEGALPLVSGPDPVYEIVNLGESRTISLSRMVAELGEQMGVTPQVQWLPVQPGDVQRTFADISKARRLLGYNPETPFEEGLRRFLIWFHAQRDITELPTKGSRA